MKATNDMNLSDAAHYFVQEAAKAYGELTGESTSLENTFAPDDRALETEVDQCLHYLRQALREDNPGINNKVLEVESMNLLLQEKERLNNPVRGSFVHRLSDGGYMVADMDVSDRMKEKAADIIHKITEKPIETLKTENEENCEGEYKPQAPFGDGKYRLTIAAEQIDPADRDALEKMVKEENTARFPEEKDGEGKGVHALTLMHQHGVLDSVVDMLLRAEAIKQGVRYEVPEKARGEQIAM